MARKKITRRDCLQKMTAASAGAAIGFPYIISASALGKDGHTAPSERLVMGCIGVGGQGTHNMNVFMNQPDVQVVAVCDVETQSDKYYGGGVRGRKPAAEMVDNFYKNKVGGEYKGCEAYLDYREMLVRPDIDAVTVCTPDHWHGLIAVAAANAGKHIYCEKPLTNTIAEGRAVCDAVKKNKRILQTGSHERSNERVRYACELVRNGRIGKLQTMRINLPMSDGHHKQVLEWAGQTMAEKPVPDGFDFDFWLGPTPKRPYTEHSTHFWWRFILAYGGGEMTDRGAHIIDIGQLGNGTDDTGPVEIIAKGEAAKEGQFDVYMKYDFECTYANGVKMIGSNVEPRGIKFEGSDGWIFVHVHGGKLEASKPSLLEEKIGENEIHLGRSPGHHRNFLNAILKGDKLMAPAEVGHRTATICHLLNIAMRTESKLKWDPAGEQITNNEQANKMLSRPMRKPWELPEA